MPDAEVFFSDNLKRLGSTIQSQSAKDPMAYNLYNGLRNMAGQLSEIESGLRQMNERLGAIESRLRS